MNNNFRLVCGINSYTVNKAFYWWAVEVFGEHLVKVFRDYKDNDTIVLVIEDNRASDIPYFLEKCGYGIVA